VLQVVSQGGCWHPSRPHKPALVGSIPTPATGSDLVALF